jgi:hypothetical protein
VTLTRTSADGGLNHLVAVVKNAPGGHRRFSPLTLLDFETIAPPHRCASRLDLDLAGDLSGPRCRALPTTPSKETSSLLRRTRIPTPPPSVLSVRAGSAGTSLADPDVPDIDHGWYYVVRGLGCGGNSTWDDGVGAAVRATRPSTPPRPPARSLDPVASPTRARPGQVPAR